MKTLGEIFNILPTIKVLEENYSDTQVKIDQLISLLGMNNRVVISIPPKNLQIRVAGAYKSNFFLSGRNMIHDMENILNGCGKSFFEFVNILDFGCGCGRHLIPLSFLVDPAKVTGTDIDKHAIRWLKSNYPSFMGLDVNGVRPPLRYASETFDFVYGVSVFTHLPEKMQHGWLNEVSRILKPGGFGLFTTHGEKHYSKLTRSALQQLSADGFYYSIGKATDGLPDFYQTSYQTHDYIHREWARYFEVVALHARGIGKNHDAVLVRKRP